MTGFPDRHARLTEGFGALAALVATPAEDDGDRLVDTLEVLLTMVPGARWATMGERTRRVRPQTVATTGESGRLADAVQFRLGEGPTLRALERRVASAVSDLTVDRRWPRLAAMAADLPVRSVLALPLRGAQGRDASLTLYAPTADAFEDAALQLMPVTVASADIALAGLRQRQRAQNLNRALLSNRRIGVSVGILMAQHQWTEDQAFQALGDVSQSLNRKVADLAEEVCLTGALPEPAAHLALPAPRPAPDVERPGRRPRAAVASGVPAHPGR